ncbi:hypothetical protein Fleli_1758 [Bernardetia litoralis DSM 6794]|uniref:Uncharacterized protein n=1 Tax=Bernardetia litoralis (strain ATCC 23117 / DSM 6794 / NBRC 15988 / NCIMB 1366 / Fx l1 / Sio-4) TaxID=880071 RepID=I4AJM2_BERLS|nr:hypothetical protein [Bernardetia litoralis]AFM04157.1 hypothetical protein Fleli_1758 [Bernardetia litoralis DSM 6794]
MNEKEVRKKYFEAIGNERKIKRLLKQLQETKKMSALLLAYCAACESMMAQFSWNPYTKLAQVTKSFELFEKAINDDSKDIEIRFLRFSVQHNVPDFLRKNREFEEDKTILVENFENADFDTEFREFIISYLKDSKRFEKNELEILG